MLHVSNLSLIGTDKDSFRVDKRYTINWTWRSLFIYSIRIIQKKIKMIQIILISRCYISKFQEMITTAKTYIYYADLENVTDKDVSFRITQR